MKCEVCQQQNAVGVEVRVDKPIFTCRVCSGPFDEYFRPLPRTNFDDVGDFHEKFDLDNVTHRGSVPKAGKYTAELQKKLIEFRTRFMQEELDEFSLGAQEGDHAKMFDALLDLAYVVFGTAHVLGYPWQEGWDEVQRANMTKERCGIDHKFEQEGGGHDACTKCFKPKSAHSLRGSAYDVIKPAGWTAPDIAGVLKHHGFE
jgi:predicted HAD superfamily Cof-like phosphohydrolase